MGYAAPAFGVLDGVTSFVVGSAPGKLVVYSEMPVKLEFAATKISPFNGMDVGLNSKPAFVDLDNDGDQDLVVGEFDGVLEYWRNVGTASQPNFQKVDDESPFDGIDVRFRSAPALVPRLSVGVRVLRRTDVSYEGAVSPPRRLFVGAAEKRRKRVRPT